ncbi:MULTISPECIES: hypothetical protein [Bradyrhizobium]|uniref:hypothetical protein n=1 Tax=Bradyrhizobium TaxID=374 RepID=UPI0011440E7D|nr:MULTISPECIES: hypothetical protein [Bradyrhizobium]UFW49001.1 hypothetical protein BaraCB756_43380 [Bradyrhizobium arachidis]
MLRDFPWEPGNSNLYFGFRPRQFQRLDRAPEIRTKIRFRKMFAAMVPAQGLGPVFAKTTPITSSHASRAERRLLVGARLDIRKTNEHF